MKEQQEPVFVLNGPNLNMLGLREPEIYGDLTLADIETVCRGEGDRLGLSVDVRQSNHEGQLVDWVQEAREAACGVVLNAAAYSHTSVALLDAVKLLEQPVIEVHISNIYARETFRHHSYISQAAGGVICGLGVKGYIFALEAIASMRQ